MGRMPMDERVARLAHEKSTKLNLRNHITGWGALCRIWDEHPEHQRALKLMGYGVLFAPLDFSYRQFAPNNGSSGKCPVMPNEWRKIGIQKTLCR